MIYLSEKMGRFILFVLGTAFFAPFPSYAYFAYLQIGSE